MSRVEIGFVIDFPRCCRINGAALVKSIADRKTARDVCHFFVAVNLGFCTDRPRKSCGAVARARFFVADVVTRAVARISGILRTGNTRVLLDVHVRVDTHVTHRRTTVAEEDVQIISGAFHERIAILIRQVVENGISRSREVRSAKVHSKLATDKDPNIIVTAEVKAETRLVNELSMAFKTELLVARTRPTIRSPCKRSIRSVLKARPTCRPAILARPSPHTCIRSPQPRVYGSNVVIAVSKTTGAIIHSSEPTCTIAKQIKFLRIFRRIHFTEQRTHKDRAFCTALGSCKRNRCRTIIRQNIRVRRCFGWIKTSLSRQTFARIVIGIKLPLTVSIAIERKVKASHFVHTRSRMEKLIEKCFANKARFTHAAHSRRLQKRLLVRIQSVLDNAVRHTDTGIYRSLGLSRRHSLRTILAAFTTSRVARESRVQFGIRIVNDSCQMIFAVTIHGRIHNRKALFGFRHAIRPHACVRNKENRIRIQLGKDLLHRDGCRSKTRAIIAVIA